MAFPDTPTTYVDGTTTITAAQLNAVEKMLVGPAVYNVQGYGATGDGTTDDTTAVQDAITAAAGGTVFLPGGTYIVENLTVSTAGTRLVALGGDATLKLKAGAATPTILTLAAVDCAVMGVSFNPNDVTNGVCIEVGSSGSRARVQGNTFTNPKSGGVHISGTPTDILITGNTFSGPGYGVLVADASTVARLTITGNVFRGGSAGDGIEINTPDGGATDVTIAGNTISDYTSTSANAGLGIGLANVTNASVTGNTVFGCSGAGIHIEDRSKNVSVSGNVVHDCDDAGIDVLVLSAAPCRSITITGNVVYNCCLSPHAGPPARGAGAIEVGNSLSQVYGAVVAGNVCYDNAQAGIYAYDCRSIVIANNLCFDNAGPGLDLITVINGRITGNLCLDTQGTKTQTYGLRTLGSGQDALFLGNNFLNNLTGAVDNGFSTAPVWRENQGYVTRNYGATSVADGGTVTHGLAAAPTRISATATASGEFVSVTSWNSTTFTVAIKTHAGAAGTTQAILWEAEC